MWNLFRALSRLTTALNRAAEIFETANEQLDKRLAVNDTIDTPQAPALEDHRANGRKVRQAVS